MKSSHIASLVIALIGVAASSGEVLATTYWTSFPLTEDPISEGGRWIGGKTVGLAWNDFQSRPGLAFGKEPGDAAGVYDDAIALLTGIWGPDQTVQATVKTMNQNDSIFEELEIRLRSTVTPNSSTGYECLFSARSSSNAYIQIVRWNGPFGDFTHLDARGGTSMALHDNDTIACTISGSTITAFINGVQKLQVVDGTFMGGNPGIGAFLQNGVGVNADYGFKTVMASDEPTSVVTPRLLTVTLTGDGGGVVTSDPAGIACGSDCLETYASPTSVTLTAAPWAGSTFAGWAGGPCAGTGTCTVWIDSDVTVAAHFAYVGSDYSHDYVQKAYVAYYGRPADPAGQAYWSGRMDAEGQSLSAIIRAFGTSNEFNTRYGGLTYAELVTKIYQQALARDPDQAGLAYYVGLLQSGLKTLQSITLDVLNGATGPSDYATVANKMDVARYYTSKVAGGCSYGTAQDAVAILSGVTSIAATVALAKSTVDVRCGGVPGN